MTNNRCGEAPLRPERHNSAGRRTLSIVLPARNEASAIGSVLSELRTKYPHAEILVVDDASADNTGAIAAEYGVRVLRQRHHLGNGAAVKRGARAATGDVLVFMDADGQHNPADIARMLIAIEAGADMVVGARDVRSQATLSRRLANGFYNRLASYITGQPIADLTSGLRAARAEAFRRFLYLLPNGFSYPTTITLAFFRSGLTVDYLPIATARRNGKSHIRPMRDGLRFLVILFKMATLYSPLKIFLPVSASFFATGLGYYLYTFVTASRFTNMSALLLTAAVMIFLMGLISEQITALNYRDSDS
jgi:glycosyltransferase involved in cell wall biosynthesis